MEGNSFLAVLQYYTDARGEVTIVDSASAKRIAGGIKSSAARRARRGDDSIGQDARNNYRGNQFSESNKPGAE